MVAKGTRTSILGIVGFALAVGVVAPAGLPAWAQGTQSAGTQILTTQINRSLPGSKTGILTRAKGTSLVIDRANYVLAPGAPVENKGGTPLELPDIQADGVAYDVQYWLGTGSADKQITQMVITFPE